MWSVEMKKTAGACSIPRVRGARQRIVIVAVVERDQRVSASRLQVVKLVRSDETVAVGPVVRDELSEVRDGRSLERIDVVPRDLPFVAEERMKQERREAATLPEHRQVSAGDQAIRPSERAAEWKRSFRHYEQSESERFKLIQKSTAVLRKGDKSVPHDQPPARRAAFRSTTHPSGQR